MTAPFVPPADECVECWDKAADQCAGCGAPLCSGCAEERPICLDCEEQEVLDEMANLHAMNRQYERDVMP